MRASKLAPENPITRPNSSPFETKKSKHPEHRSVSSDASAAIARPSRSLPAAQAGSLAAAAAPGAERSSAALSPPSNTLVATTSTSPVPNATYLHLFSVPLMTYVWPDSAGLNEQLRECILSHAAKDCGIPATNVGGWHTQVHGPLTRKRRFFPSLSRARHSPDTAGAGTHAPLPQLRSHSVLPHRGSKPRISIAFNFRSEGPIRILLRSPEGTTAAQVTPQSRRP